MTRKTSNPKATPESKAPEAATPEPKPQTEAQKAQGHRLKFDRSHVIVGVVPNPKKPGSKSFDRFEAYTEGMTVQAALDAGVTAGDLRWDTKRGFITIEPAA